MFKELFKELNENKFISDVKDDMNKMIRNIEKTEEETPKFRKDTIKKLNAYIKDINIGKFSKEALYQELKDLKTYIDKSDFEESGIAWVPGMMVSEFGLYANP